MPISRVSVVGAATKRAAVRPWFVFLWFVAWIVTNGYRSGQLNMEPEFRLNIGQGLWPPPPLELALAFAMPDEDIDLLIDRMSRQGSVQIDRLIADALRLPDFSSDVAGDAAAGSRPRRLLRALRRRLPGA